MNDPLENTLNYGLERVWSISCLKGSNDVAIGYDEGSILIKLGREEPAMSMDSSGKIIWAKHCEVQQANLKAIAGNICSFWFYKILRLNLIISSDLLLFSVGTIHLS